MERDGAHSPDAASIRPVSSLRAKFEGLQTQNLPKPDLGPYKPSPSTLRPTEPTKQSPTIRASLDLPRPQSPWSLNHHNDRPTPNANNASRTAESPTRSQHKRPNSMLLHSSPQLPPSVQVEPPKSPPRILFPRRGASKSPDRLETASQSNLPSVTPQSSSREPSRSPARPLPRPDPSPARLPDTRSTSAVRSRSPVPPPVNRADKPRIPAKPAIAPVVQHDAVLSPTSRRPSAEPRISPFSTPPSSDDGASPPNVLGQALSVEDPPALPKLSASVEERGRPYQDQAEPSRGRDPRFMGFNAPRSAVEKKDPRMLGFSKPEPVRPPSRDAQRPKTTVKIPSQNSSAMPSRDPRHFGFDRENPSSAKSQHEPQLNFPPSSRIELPSSAQTPIRDPRNFGFNSARQSPPREEARPELPQRHQPKIPPPRPSEDTKRPVYQPGIMSRPQRSLPPPAAESRPKPSGEIPRQTVINTSDVRFPPPPKRATGDDDDSRRGTPISSTANSMFGRRASADQNARAADDSDDAEEGRSDPIAAKHEYPDATQTNRRPPIHSSGLWEINSKTDGKVFDVCGKFLCAASYHTRVFDLATGESLVAINHGETIKTTAVCFKPGASIDAEGKRIWIGNNVGDLQEIDIETQSIVSQSSAHNRREIHRIFRHQKDIWTLDDEGKLFVWGADENGTPNLKYSHVSYKLARPPTFSLVVHDKLWVASGKEIRIYKPGNDASFNVLKSPLAVQAASDVTCGTFSDSQAEVYLGHADGKVTVYSTKDYTCRANIKVSDYKINGLTFVDNKLWAVYKTGKVYVYDTSSSPWKVKKDWRAHNGPATGIMLDPSSIWTLNKLQVITTGHDQYIRLWDGLLEDDWIETAMHDRNAEYCSFREVRAAITTWNCGAAHPGSLKTDFIADAVHCDDPDPPEILVFGFQEVVDLEDRSITAKSLLGFGKSKNKTADSSESQSRVYREWRDYLSRCVERYIPHHVYTELHTSSLIGLFQCIFVRMSERRHITNLSAAPIKTGMGGHYGNKGALLARFILDDSSLVFINCHLAAGQTHTSNRNNDVATILESEALPSESDLPTRSTLYTGGGDGSQILDHEIAILNGDLNYRIDTIPRDTVIKHINNNNLAPLLERDQINVSRRRVSGFRLAPFIELPIKFAPTYKYDVGTDRYDTSEKKRAPAWCDRILYRSSGGNTAGLQTVQQLEYRRHEGVRESDHRPVSGVFSLQIKKVDVARQRAVMEDSYIRFEGVKRRVAESECLRYLVSYLGVRPEEAKKKLLAL